MKEYRTDWAAQCAALREKCKMTQQQLADALSGPDAATRCSVANVREWEQGGSTPPGWVQAMILGQAMRQSLRPLRSARSTPGR